MKNHLRERWPILLLPLLFCSVDWLLTWRQLPPLELRTAQNVPELNPIAKSAMLSGLGAEIGLQILWALLIVIPIWFLPRFLSYCWSFAWTFGHACAVMTWLIYGYKLGFWTIFWYSPLVAALTGFASKHFFSTDRLPETKAH